MEKFQNKYRIPSTRLQQWDYGQRAAYFITICTHDRICYFGDVMNGKMILSGIGIIADVLWYEIKNHVKDIELGEFVVMPNHVHGILILKGHEPNDTNIGQPVGREFVIPTDPAVDAIVDADTADATQTRDKTIGQNRFQNQGKNTLSSIVGSYKSAVSKHAHRLGFEFKWQPRFYDRIIWDELAHKTISKYIINNPSKWNEDTFNRK